MQKTAALSGNGLHLGGFAIFMLHLLPFVPVNLMLQRLEKPRNDE